MNMRQHLTFDELVDTATRRGMFAELTVGPQRGEKGRDYRTITKVRVTDKNKRIVVERPVDNDEFDKAAAGCLGFLHGTTPR